MVILLIIFALLPLVIMAVFGLISKKEAESQGRDGIKWFWLGFFFSINAFIALKISKVAFDKGHDIKLWSILGVIFGATIIVAFETGIIAESKQHDFVCWVILGVMFELPALLISCFLKELATPEIKEIAQ